MNSLEKIIGSKLCAGCGLCEALFGRDRVEMRLDSAGFLRPHASSPLSEQESMLLYDVCPGVNVQHIDPPDDIDPLWGPLRSIHIAASADRVIRRLGSSGGVLSALQVHLLETGKVDYIVGTSVAGDDPLGTEVNICRSREDVMRGAGSRYAPSAPLKRILELLDAPGRFAFVGKPCDVAALRRYGKQDERVAAKIPYLLSFLCAGVPSRRGSARVIEKLGVKMEDVASFRYRGDGWPGLTLATLNDGTSRSMSYIESWGNILGHFLQWRCKLCPDGTGEFADIACGDAWQLKHDGTPDFSEHEGRSFLLARSSQGIKLAQEAMSAGAIEIINNATPSDLEAVQFHQSYRRKTMLVRYMASACLGIEFPRYHLRLLIKASRRVGFLSLIRVFFGALKRGLKVRAGR